MTTLMLVMMTLAITLGLGLIGAGAWYQLNRQRLHADPVLIKGCYLFGAALLLSNLAIPVGML